MTAVVGIRCADGIVIASDSSTTLTVGDFRTIEQKCEKVQVIDDAVVLTGTGAVGLQQRFREIVRIYWEKKEWRGKDGKSKSSIEVATDLSRLAVNDFTSTGLRDCNYGALLAFPAEKTFHLCEFAHGNFQPELKEGANWFVSMGSGQPITDPFLGLLRRVFWPEGCPPRRVEGVFAATWTLQHVIELNPGGINGPMQIAVLDDKLRAGKLDDSELAEHTECCRAAEEYLARFRDRLSGQSGESIPQPPSSDSRP